MNKRRSPRLFGLTYVPAFADRKLPSEAMTESCCCSCGGDLSFCLSLYI